jgi:cation diffusion facilitator CzcD-associated flavoprotein CzcO
MPPDLVVIGAGPYGLSVASHLRERGINFRIFGRPMHSWRAHMPAGMQLKSESFATNLSDPAGSFTLERFCIDHGMPVADHAAVPLDKFVAYGAAFQRRFVPEVDERTITAVVRQSDRFEVTVEGGERLLAARVILATGLYPFRNMVPSLAGLPADLASHSADHAKLDGFAGRDVTVIGGGSSAAELAVLLLEAGANVRLMSRRAGALNYQPRPIQRPAWRRALRPLSGIGYGWQSVLLSEAPQLFHLLPSRLRIPVVQRYLMPAPGWFVRDRFEGRVEHRPGQSLHSATATGHQVELLVQDSENRALSLRTDHVIAATGYRLDIDLLSLLGSKLRRDLARVGGSPRLSPHFESSVPSLYFLGPLSANSFGPAMRFVLGADFAAKRVTRHLESLLCRRSSVRSSPAYAER